MPITLSIDLDFFKSRSLVIKDCWVWNRYVGKNGYGQFTHKNKRYNAHNAVLRLVKGPPAPGQEALHSCDNTRCVNPNHLSWGTHTENMRDMWNKGRAKPGPIPSRAILTSEQVEAIQNSVLNGRELAKQYGVHFSTISKIRTNKNWR